MDDLQAKNIINYNRQVEVFGKEKADNALQFFLLGANGYNTNTSKKDTIKLRLIFLEAHWNSQYKMYEGWYEVNLNNRKNLWKEKSLMSYDIRHSITKLINEINKDDIEIPIEIK